MRAFKTTFVVMVGLTLGLAGAAQARPGTNIFQFASSFCRGTTYQFENSVGGTYVSDVMVGYGEEGDFNLVCPVALSFVPAIRTAALNYVRLGYRFRLPGVTDMPRCDVQIPTSTGAVVLLPSSAATTTTSGEISFDFLSPTVQNALLLVGSGGALDGELINDTAVRCYIPDGGRVSVTGYAAEFNM